MLGARAVYEVPFGPRNRRRDLLVAGQSLLLAPAIAAAVVYSDASDWPPPSLFAALLALGPAPAAVIAVAAVLAWSLKARTPWSLAFNNVVALTTYPVVGGLLFKAVGDPGADTTASFGTAVLVFAIYLATNFLNFLLIVGYLCLRDRASIVGAV